MEYILRAVIHENIWKKQVKEIIEFCKFANIDEVYLKEQCHQILMSPFVIEKHKEMGKIYCEIARELKQNNITHSINIATIAGHCDGETCSEETLPFQKFVGQNMVPNVSTCCILDENWQNYACEVGSIYAKTGPSTIMVDDDFRSVNHGEYLGCFCPLHAKAVSAKLGENLTGEQLKDYVLSDSEKSKKVRKIWQEINFDAQMSAAKKISGAIHSIDKNINVGLMNSGEPNHSVQGRDIKALIQQFAAKNKGVSRPLGGAYEDSLHQKLIDMHQGMALSIAQLPKDTVIVSEVENWPHTRYTKSISQTKLQMKLHVLAGADKVSMNIFDFMGTPYAQEPEFCDMIKENKKYLQDLYTKRQNKTQSGIGLLWHKNTSANIDAQSNMGMGILPERVCDNLFAQLGIITCFEESEVNYISGQYVKCISDDDVIRLLSKGAILDGEAIFELDKRGFSKYLGCEVSGEISDFSAERLINSAFAGKFNENLLPTNWMRLHLKNKKIPSLKASGNSICLSQIENKEYEKIADGITLFENSLGGKVCCIPAYISTWTFAYRSRAFVLRNIVKYLYNSDVPVFLEDAVNVAPFYYVDENKKSALLALINTGLDTEKTNVTINGSFADYKTNKFELELAPLTLKVFDIKL